MGGMKKLGILLLFAPLFSWGQDARNVALLGHWHTDGLPENTSLAFYNEVWGFVVEGEEFGVIGSTLGSHIIHIKGNNNLEEVAFIPGTQQGPHVIHRDYATYGNYLLSVGDQEPAKLQVIDVSNLPESAELVYESSENMTKAHNVFVDEPAARAYMCGTNAHALEIFDLTDPEIPAELPAAQADFRDRHAAFSQYSLFHDFLPRIRRWMKDDSTQGRGWSSRNNLSSEAAIR